MASQDLKNNVLPVVAFDTQAITSDTTTAGNIVDSQGFEGITFMIQSGTLVDGDYALLIEDGNDAGLSDAAAVTDTFLIGTEADASFLSTEDDVVKQIGYVGHNRYVRMSLVSTSVTGGGTLGGTAVKSHADHNPAS